MRKSCRIPEKSGHNPNKEIQSGSRFLGNFGTMSRDSDCLIDPGAKLENTTGA